MKLKFSSFINFLFFPIAIFGLIPSAVRAQPDLNLTLKSGPNVTTLSKEHRIHRYGLSGGISGSFKRPLIGRFSLGGQVDLLYTPRGAEVVFEGVYLGKTRQHYFDIMAAVRPEARIGSVSVYLLVGGGLNLLLSAYQEDSSGMEMDITDGLSRYDVALLGAAGVTLQLPHQELGPLRLDTVFLEARHDRGLIDIDNGNDDFKNRSTSLMLGVSFALGSGKKDIATARNAPPP